MEKGSKQISAYATVTNVLNYMRLTDEETDKILADNQTKLNLSEKQKERWHKKFLCLVEFDDVHTMDPPLVFERQANMDDWLILEKIEDVVAGTSIRYSYEKSRF